MKPFLLLLSALPITAAYFAARFFSFKHLRSDRKVSQSLGEILHALKEVTPSLKINVRRLAWAGNPVNNKNEAVISENKITSHSTQEIADELIKVGYAKLAEQFPEMIRYRINLLRYTHLAPPFVLLTILLAAIVRRFPLGWGITVLCIAVAAGCVMMFMSQRIEKEAVREIVRLIERRSIIHKADEQKQLIDALNAWPWARLLPPCSLHWLLKKKQ